MALADSNAERRQQSLPNIFHRDTDRDREMLASAISVRRFDPDEDRRTLMAMGANSRPDRRGSTIDSFAILKASPVETLEAFLGEVRRTGEPILHSSLATAPGIKREPFIFGAVELSEEDRQASTNDVM